MRPTVSDPFATNPRKSPLSDLLPTPTSPLAEQPHREIPETFFLAQDDDIQGSCSTRSGTPQDSTYGIRSLEDTISEGASGSRPQLKTEHDVEPSIERSNFSKEKEIMPSVEGSSPMLDKLLRPCSPGSARNKNSLSATPSILESPAEPTSLPSSPRSTSINSFKPADTMSIPDDVSIQAIASSSDGNRATSPDFDNGAPQLVMPSIKMPSRRPFTDRGKLMGRLKLLVAGAPGSGKTSLLKSIVQTCEDIVHVDPLPDTTYPAVSHSKSVNHNRKSTSKSQRGRSRGSVSEIYASTKPYPSWWSGLEDSRVLRRRRSLDDVILERNICFVDTCCNKINGADNADHVVQYINRQFSRAVSAVQKMNNDLQGLLSGNGGSQVDVILYLISEGTIEADIQNILRLSEYTTVIPLISKADTLSQAQIHDLKCSFSEKTQDEKDRPVYLGPFGRSLPDSTFTSIPHVPFAVSSANTPDDETMEASILMSPDYVQPLIASELQFLLTRLFDQDNIAWLRQSAARKLIDSQTHHSRPQSGHLSTTTSNSGVFSPFGSRLASPRPSSSASHVLVSGPASIAPSEYTLARVTDHSQREEHLAQVQLVRWASDLQRSLQNERERYEQLDRSERAVWLTEKLGECVADGTLVPISQTPGFPSFGEESTTEKNRGGRHLNIQTRDGRQVKYQVMDIRAHDPLGVIRWNEDFQRRGWMLVQVIGSVGIVGGLALWVAKTWGFTSQGLSGYTTGWLNGND